MTAILVGGAVALGILLVVSVAGEGLRRLRRLRWQRREQRRMAARPQEHLEARRWEQAADARPDAELLAARREASALVADASRDAAEIRTLAERAAHDLLAEAERKASQLLAEAERKRAALEEELARERRQLDEKRLELSSLLLALQADLQRTLGDGTTNVRTLDAAREARAASGVD